MKIAITFLHTYKTKSQKREVVLNISLKILKGKLTVKRGGGGERRKST